MPVLSMPDKRGRFTLYSNTSKHATGSALYQVQDGNAKANCLCEQKNAGCSKELFHKRVGNVWSSYKYGNFC